jgi:hypothetical protein
MVGLAGCFQIFEYAQEFARPRRRIDDSTPDHISYWDDSVAAGKLRIVIDLGQQQAFFSKGDKLANIPGYCIHKH